MVTMVRERRIAVVANPVWREEAQLYLGDRPLPDWETLIDVGTVPALVLGGERRLHRTRSRDEGDGAPAQQGGDR